MARKQSSGKRKRQALEKIDPKTVRHGKMLAEAANRYPKTVKWGKLSGCGQVLGKMLAEAAKRYPKTVHRQAEAASVGQKSPENSPTWKNVSRSGQALPKKSPAASGSGPALPENSPAGQNVSRSGQPLPENSQVGKIERMRPSVVKNVSGSGQALPENRPGASGSGPALPENSPAASGSGQR